MAADIHISDAMIAQSATSSMFNPWHAMAPSRFGWAGVLSVVVHAALGVAVMGMVVRAPEIAAPIRVVLYDPPPPAINSPSTVVPATVQTAPRQHAPVHLAKAARKPLPRINRRAAPVVAQAHPEEPLPPAVEVAASQPGDGVAGGVVGGVVGGNGRTLLSAEEASVQPIAISKVMPQYPPVARVRGIEGQVVLEAILAADGHVEPDITVVQSVPLLDNAAPSMAISSGA